MIILLQRRATALHIAALLEQWQPTLSILLDAGADVDARDKVRISGKPQASTGAMLGLISAVGRLMVAPSPVIRMELRR